MKNRGFTLVELITTFALSAVIIVLLINIIVVIRNIYSKTDLKTELYINQGNLSNLMNKKINKNNLVFYETCTDEEFCYKFVLSNEENLTLSVSDDTIKFGSLVYKIKEGTKIENPSVTKEYIPGISDSNDSFLIIRIPIKSDIYPGEDFGINLVYPYNSNEVSL